MYVIPIHEFRLFPRHPRIVCIYGVYTKDPSYYGMLVECCELGDLRTLLDKMDTHLSNQHIVILDIAQVKCHDRNSILYEYPALDLFYISSPSLGEFAGDAIPGRNRG